MEVASQLPAPMWETVEPAKKHNNNHSQDLFFVFFSYTLCHEVTGLENTEHVQQTLYKQSTADYLTEYKHELYCSTLNISGTPEKLEVMFF